MSEALEISPDVLYGIAQLALDQVEGMVAIAPPARVGEFLTGRRAKGIGIERTSDGVEVHLNVRVEYGIHIPQAAIEAQRVVREAVTSMTGLDVTGVIVTVESIELPEGLRRG